MKVVGSSGFAYTPSVLAIQNSEGTVSTTRGLVAWNTAVDALVVVLPGSCVFGRASAVFGETDVVFVGTSGGENC